jgi:hypothetical protein
MQLLKHIAPFKRLLPFLILFHQQQLVLPPSLPFLMPVAAVALLGLEVSISHQRQQRLRRQHTPNGNVPFLLD